MFRVDYGDETEPCAYGTESMHLTVAGTRHASGLLAQFMRVFDMNYEQRRLRVMLLYFPKPCSDAFLLGDESNVAAVKEGCDVAIEGNGCDVLQVLPLDVFYVVLSELSAADVSRCSQVNREWRRVCSEDSVWHRLYQECWGHFGMPLNISDWRLFFGDTMRLLHVGGYSLILAEEEEDGDAARNRLVLPTMTFFSVRLLTLLSLSV